MDSSQRRRVLVIAYYFPPMGLSGVQRTLKFVKYLPTFGWDPTVLTVEPQGYLARDESLLEDLEGKNIRIERTNQAGPARALARKGVVQLPPEWSRKLLSRLSDSVFIPDNKIGWKSAAVRKALALHAETPFDLIFATAPPFTALLVGREVKAQLNRPLVFDYRDPWVEYPFRFYPTPFHKLAHAGLERRALKASSHVVTTNRKVKELLIRRHGFLGYNDIDIIPQGYDPEDFNGVTPPPPQAGRIRKMRVTYAGVFWEDRVPDYFLRALQEIFTEQPRLRGRIVAEFVGAFREGNRRLVRRLGLHDAVEVMGYLSHKETVRRLVAADVLWMIVGDDLGSPGKTYEYIGARKPILGCAPEGFIRQTILEAGGTVTAPDDVRGIKEALLAFYGQFEQHQMGGPPEEVVRRYNRVTLTNALVKIFETLVEA
jgi:glycosyltransferase involved in cell wall biosynthesis